MKTPRLLYALLLMLLPLISFAQEVQEQAPKGLDERINEWIEPYTKAITLAVFYPQNLYDPEDTMTMPLVIIFLLLAATFFTFYFKFVNIRGFRTSVETVKGTYSKIEDEGEVSHFQALTAALSGTVGLGNIAGVAVAISLGGPGATFWMIVAGFLGMSSKFVECTLGVKYRDVGPDGTVYGGPMYYLSKGLKARNLAGLGKVLAAFFAIMCIGGSFGGGNMFQANQAAQQFNNLVGATSGNAGFLFGLVIAVFVALVIIGGIKRIGKVTEKIVPFMVGIYLLAAIIILVVNYAGIPSAFGKIFTQAFTPMGITGGFVGVLIQGFRRAAFSNEAGIGSAAIAHSAVRTNYPASEGYVAQMGPFIDTVVICTMTALVIIVTGTYNNSTGDGVALTSEAFQTVLPWFPYVLTVAVILFAFSTMISWSYYGLQAWMYLFGRSKVADLTYKLLFCTFVVIGASASLQNVIDFSDAMIFAMAVPNLIGLFLLTPVVKEEMKRYLNAIRQMKESGKV
ncbi:MAG TPA: alanine:cation symporter family protein [Phaeodactylibacter sp.]|nr:alanine:cation symporter family protein [Phaeodactylibacter sp.]